ncbi:MAG: DUF4921 family protein, partial [Planctomycetota bacterium]
MRSEQTGRLAVSGKPSLKQPLVDRSDVDESRVDRTTVTSPAIKHRQQSQSRRDPFTGNWTLFAADRARRPDQYGPVSIPESLDRNCAFCMGHEHETPDPVHVVTLSPEDQTQPEPWNVRVVPNLYPAISAGTATPSGLDQCFGGESNKKDITHSVLGSTSRSSRDSLFACEPSVGGHEVIIESSRHTRSFSELSVAEVALVFETYASRMRYWAAKPEIRYISVFKNVGRDAGASLQHSHSQLLASSRLPSVVDGITRRMQSHHARTGSCLQCDVIREELAREQRIVFKSDSLVAYCPYASAHPLMLRIAPTQHQPHYFDANADQIDAVSHLVWRAVRWLEAMRPDVAYNLLIHSCPPQFEGDHSSQHWSI